LFTCFATPIVARWAEAIPYRQAVGTPYKPRTIPELFVNIVALGLIYGVTLRQPQTL